MKPVTATLAGTALLLGVACMAVTYRLHADQETIARQEREIALLRVPPASTVVPAVQAPRPPQTEVADATPPARKSDFVVPFEEGAKRMRASMEEREKLLQHPKYRAAVVERQRMNMREMLRDARYWVPMSDQAFEELLRLRAAATIDQQALRAPDDLSPAEARTRANERWEHHQAELRRLLGEQGHARWQEWEQASQERGTLTALNGRLAVGDVVRGDKGALAASAMQQARVRSREATLKTESPLPDGWATMDATARSRYQQEKDLARTARENESMLAAAAPHLSTAQLDSMRNYYNEVQESQRLNMERRLKMPPPGAMPAGGK